MTTQTWPASLPRYPLVGSYQEEIQPFVAEFQPDVGVPNRWARSAQVKVTASFRLLLTAAERTALIGFYGSTCRGGTLPFAMFDPLTDISTTFYWASAPSFADIERNADDKQFTAGLKLSRLQ